MDPAVLKAMLPYLKNKFGNAASIHHVYGQQGKEAVENSRNLLAKSIKGYSRDIIFTSGATSPLILPLRACVESIRKMVNILLLSKLNIKRS
ncbi:MAG: hypothetical protein Ct9H300mP29_9190 [Candidatus Neomarinimicrobiota bacterium]|nr:MAG: hypothetical protein Ct9H300mP29_9190 [Candidatus Neomarinimicrobiota bacterium]